MYKYFDNYTSILVAEFILTPATKLKNKTNDIRLHYNDNYDMITVTDPTPETSRKLNIFFSLIQDTTQSYETN